MVIRGKIVCARLAKHLHSTMIYMQAASRPLHPSPCANACGSQVTFYILPSACQIVGRLRLERPAVITSGVTRRPSEGRCYTVCLLLVHLHESLSALRRLLRVPHN